MNSDRDRLPAALGAQERRLVFQRFDNGAAWRLGVPLVDAAHRRGFPLVVGRWASLPPRAEVDQRTAERELRLSTSANRFSSRNS